MVLVFVKYNFIFLADFREFYSISDSWEEFQIFKRDALPMLSVQNIF
jgi:hypothetical protein